MRATQVAPGFEMMGHASSWWRVAVWQLLVFHVWVALTPVILWLGRRFKPEQSHWVGTLATHVLLGSAVTLFYLFIYSY